MRIPRYGALCHLLLLAVAACSSSTSSSDDPARGGTNSNGGDSVNPSGGVAGSSGSNSAGGMTATSGGATSVFGGANSGGVSSGGRGNGGTSASAGGISSAGAANGGGANASGGSHAAGGVSANGGNGAGGSTGVGGTNNIGGESAAGAGTCTPPTPGSKGTNPLFTDAFTADPAPFVDHCTFYIQCGHDEAAAGQNGFVMREWFLLSSTDLVHWTKKVALKLSDFKWANANAWAGQMVTKNGKYYWFVPVQESSSGAMAIGVAVADSPSGPFTDAIGKPLINDAFEMSNVGFANPSATPYTIDPTVFVDDDGQAYLQYGGFGRMMTAKLGDDMISIAGKMKEETPPGFFEAAFLTKRNGTYYEIYAAGQNPATIDYSTSSNPQGPWTRKGRVLDAFPGAAGQDAPTNHSGVAQFGDQWFIVYHVSNGPNGGGTYRREVAIDKLDFNSDGTIKKLVPSSGLSF